MESITKIKISTKANLGKRFMAGFIDYTIVFGFMGVMFYFYGEQTAAGYVLSGTPFYAVIIFGGLMTIGVEQVVGATLGNFLFDLKPISIEDLENKRVNIGQSIKRHIGTFIDLLLFGFVAVLLIKNTEHHQRLGDIWAKTIVVDTTDEFQGVK